MQLLKNYKQSANELLSYFGYEFNWLRGHYIGDYLDHYWYLDDSNKMIHFAITENELNEQCDDYYEEPFSAVYRGAEYSLVIMMNHGVSELNIFDNLKERGNKYE